MKKYIKYFLVILFCTVVITCKKKTTVRIKLLNPALNEYVANATIVLVERYTSGSQNADCKEIAETVTDTNGECRFDKEKLRSSSHYDYYCAVKESWGLQQNYTCAGKTSGFLNKGGNQDYVVTDEADGFVKIQYNNLLNPSQLGDSLIVSLSTVEYSNPKGGTVQGGGGVFGDFPFYECNGFPFPAIVLLEPIKIKGQRLKRYIRKHKLGVITTSIDTVKVYPNQTTTVVIDW